MRWCEWWRCGGVWLYFWRLIELGKVVLYHECLHHAVYFRLLKTPTNAEISELVETSVTDRLSGCVCHWSEEHSSRGKIQAAQQQQRRTWTLLPFTASTSIASVIFFDWTIRTAPRASCVMSRRSQRAECVQLSHVRWQSARSNFSPKYWSMISRRHANWSSA